MPTLSAFHAPEYLRLASLLVKHRRVAGAGSSLPEHEEVERDAAELVRELEAMGPTFLKLGQLLASRSDLLPTEYLQALGRLRDGVAAWRRGETPLPGCLFPLVTAELVRLFAPASGDLEAAHGVILSFVTAALLGVLMDPDLVAVRGELDVLCADRLLYLIGQLSSKELIA